MSNDHVVNKELESWIEKVSSNIDPDYMEDFIKEFISIGDCEKWGGVHSGSDAEHEGAALIEKRLREIGVHSVERIPVSTNRFQFNKAVIIAGDREIRPYAYTAPGTAGISAPIINVGKSTRDVYETNFVKGKIALVEAMGFIEGASLSCQIQEAESKGAAAVIVEAVEETLNDLTIRVQPLNYIAEIPVLGVSGRDAEYLKGLGKNEKTISICADIDFTPDKGTTYEVVGEIAGTKSRERIIYSCHYDHYFRCVQDDVSAVALLLGVAEAMIKADYKPERTITFVFNASHETGNLNSRYPYIAGSYKLIDGPKADWADNTVADINFEYTALDLKRINVIGSPEMSSQYAGIIEYIPEKVKKFKPIAKAMDFEDYYMMSWCDAISYTSKGIPCISNDAITEQLYEGTSPYIGRDHSNFDDMSVFSKADIEMNSIFYAAVGMYIAAMPMQQNDLSVKVGTVLTEEEADQLLELGIKTSDLKKSIEEMSVLGAKVFHRAKNYNSKRGGFSDETEKFNSTVREATRALTDTLDKINPQDFITVAHRKHLETVMQMQNALAEIKNDSWDKAIELLKGVDISNLSVLFDKEIVDHTRESINGDSLKETRLWARGKELSCLTLYKIMQMMHEHQKFEGEIVSGLQDEIQSEIENLRAAIKAETEGLKKAAELLTKEVI